MGKIRVIAFYLPQFHPIPENDKYWGKGFTEWTNVAKAKPLFRGHYQPRIPADLGFYDLRLPEVRKEQAELAREAGVEGFCYWHYWLGGGKRLLQTPLEEVLRLGEPDFPFCLGWANHNWEKKLWNNSVSPFCRDLLVAQTYPGKQDIDDHFYTMLPAFKDKRYIRIDNRPVFLIYEPKAIPDLAYFVERWQELAKKEGLSGFYFIGQAKRKEELTAPYNKMLDAINYDCIFYFFRQSRIEKAIAYFFKRPIRTAYKKILTRYDFSKIQPNIYPTIYPNWDLTPRRGYIGSLFHNSTPALFEKHAEQVIRHTFQNENEERIVFLKSWNEWAEGNYMEPDIKFGKQYIEALHKAIHNCQKA